MATPTAPPLEVTISSRKMPRRTRNGLLITLAAALVAILVALTWLVPPTDLFSTAVWAISVAVASLLIGLYMVGFLVPTTLLVDEEGVHARQWRARKEIAFAEVQRIYLFHEGKREKLALVPREGEVWYLWLGLSEADFTAVVSRLNAVATERGIEFQRGLTFPEVYEQEAKRAFNPPR